jgi:hypothetical protein
MLWSSAFSDLLGSTPILSLIRYCFNLDRSVSLKNNLYKDVVGDMEFVNPMFILYSWIP